MKQVYTLADLASPELLDQQAKLPAKLAVIGYPIHHSASPQMHQVALDQAGINARYIRIEVPPGAVQSAFEKMQKLGFIGCNVTIPHKLEAMAACDSLSEDAVALGATNTILFSDGKVIGHNSDGPGLARAIREDFGQSLSELRILILGAGGGAGRAIATQCAREGSPLIYLSNRTESKIAPLADNLTRDYLTKEVHVIGTDRSALIAAAEKVDLIINATSLGLKPEDPLPLPTEAISADHLVYDAIYNPAVTSLLAAAQSATAKTSNGLSMLVHQGAIAFQFWTGVTPSTKAMRDALVQ